MALGGNRPIRLPDKRRSFPGRSIYDLFDDLALLTDDDELILLDELAVGILAEKYN